jgi:hypothetical protein
MGPASKLGNKSAPVRKFDEPGIQGAIQSNDGQETDMKRNQKPSKKLTLSRDTVRSMTAPALQQVAGGSDTGLTDRTCFGAQCSGKWCHPGTWDSCSGCADCHI